MKTAARVTSRLSKTSSKNTAVNTGPIDVNKLVCVGEGAENARLEMAKLQKAAPLVQGWKTRDWQTSLDFIIIFMPTGISFPGA